MARIASIGLLTEVVQDFVKPVGAIDNTNLVVYLDAPVALELLGVSGRAARANTEPVISELIRIGASVRIFSQSIDEIKNSLHAVLGNPRPTGPTAQAINRREVLKEYVTRVAQDPGAFLEDLGVKITYRTIEQTPSEHQYFTKDSWQQLYSRLTYTESTNARSHDANITTFVVRQRHGKNNRDLFKSGSVVLTRNGLLAQIVQRACADLQVLPNGMTPPVIHRRVFATAMWLRTGMGAGDLNIPKRLLLASCEQVLAIRPGVVEAVKRLTDALGDEEKTRQLDLLISQDRSTQALMDKTLGAMNVVTEENLSILFEEMLHPHLESERRAGAAEVKRVKEEGRRKLIGVENEVKVIREEGRQSAAKLEALHHEDQQIVSALCAEVSKRLAFKRSRMWFVALVLAILFCSPLLFAEWKWAIPVTLFLNIILSFLTITGGKLIGTQTSEKAALRELALAAATRRLESKVDQFDVNWVKTAFVVSEKPTSSIHEAKLGLFSDSPKIKP